ncbi:MAG: hypothetical protein BGO78_02910 [Chloroflexi bacterium 44-23]|nr:MAG: hypothetical protein BGO78_02910 [Chloroflexi bacterium 44-23]
MIEVSAKELGVENCSFVARGITAGDVIEEMFDHLEKKHDFNMPDAETTLEMYMTDLEEYDLNNVTALNTELPLDEGVKLIVQRLKEKLNLSATPSDYRG